MKIKKYTNGAWIDLDKPVKKYDTYTDETTTLPLTIEASTTDAIENYQVYGTSEGAGVKTENLWASKSSWSNSVVDSRNFFNATLTYQNGNTVVEAVSLPITANGRYSITLNATDTNYNQIRFKHSGAMRDIYIGAIAVNFSKQDTYTITFDVLGFDASVINGIRLENIMLTKGSTVPTTFIPFGYKIPILNTSGVTENLWDLDSFWTNSQTDSRDFFSARLMCLNDSTVVADKYLQINANGQYSITITSADTNYNRILFKHSGSTKDLIIGGINGDFSSQDSYTISFSVLGYNPSIAGGIKVENIMLIKGSTTPDHYIPHRYESNYDLMIGSTKLGAEEYVDYQEQKVYKRTENLFNKNAKDTNNGYVRWHVIISTGAATQDSSWDVTEYINVKPSTVYTASNCVGVTASICFYDTNKEYISGIPYSLPKPGGYGTLTFTTPNNCAYARTCVLTVNQSGAGYEFERNVDVFMITEGSTAPSSYIPYLLPTDPPVQLPPIPTYKGENNLSVDTTVQPEKVAVEYEGWKGVGDVEKYQNGEWSDNNGT